MCGAVFALVKSRESVGVWCGFCRIPKCATVSWVCKCCERRVLFMCFIVCFWWQIFPCHCEKKERRKTPVVLLLPPVLCVFFILTLFSLQLFFTSFSVHLVSFLYFICYFKSLRPVPPILVAETSSFVVASSLLLLLGFFFSLVSSSAVCRFQPQTIIIMRKLFVYMIYVFALKFCEALPPDMMTGKYTIITINKK